MVDFFNILITSISKKVPLIKMVRQSADNLNLSCQIFGGDSNPNPIARFFVDDFWHMPLLVDLTIEEVVDFCKKHQIKAIIPTRDGELPFFSRYKEYLLKHGVFCLVSQQEAIDTCRNKLLFYQKLSHLNIPVIPTSKEIKDISASSYVVKECFGAGSNSIGINLSQTQANSWAQHLKDPIFQPFIKGEEYSIDVFLSSDHSLKAGIVRKRELVIDGESQITYTLDNQEMKALCLKTAEVLGLYGHAVFQLICDESKQLHLIECNPRFGGASTLSVAMGLRSFEWFFQESLKIPLSPFKRSTKEMKMVRYPQDKIFTL